MEEQLLPYQLEPETSPWRTAFKFGALGGGVSILVGLTAYYSNLEGASWLFFLNGVVFFGSVLWAMRVHRDQELGGQITFKRAVFTGTITVTVMFLIRAVWNIIFNYIDPAIQDQLINQVIENWEASGMEEADLEKMIELLDLMFKPLNMLTLTLFVGAIWGALVSCLFAFSVSRKNRM